MALQYNLAKVYEISENDIEFALQIVTLFLEEVPAEIKSIKDAIAEKDYTRTYSSCHKINLHWIYLAWIWLMKKISKSW